MGAECGFTDGDGLPDEWENKYGLNPNSASGNDGGQADLDGDGLTNLQEYYYGTDPTDYYNGEEPILNFIDPVDQKGIVNLFGSMDRLFKDPLQVEVRNQANQLLVNAPVTFKILPGDIQGELFAQPPLTPLKQAGEIQITVRSDEEGVARAYYHSPRMLAGTPSQSSVVSEFTGSNSIIATASAEAKARVLHGILWLGFL